MPDKSQHGKGKHHSQSKKRREKQRYTTTIAHQPIAAQTSKPTVPTGMSTPSASISTLLRAHSVIAQHPHITTELRRIGILAGIILAILIVLALVLS